METTKLNLKIGGVPEHFNYPWHISINNKEYSRKGINLQWKDFEGGTGAMNKALRDGEIDIAVILTEGIIKDIIDGNPSKIVQPYTTSSLIWGIHVAKESKFKTIKDLENATIAISRHGSGSHLMAIINAQNNGWDINNLKFKVVGNLQGGLKSLSNAEADYFMWEHFTTKPYVDNGAFRIIGNCPTPWPCFMIAVRDQILKDYPLQIKEVLNIINNTTKNFKNIPQIDKELAIEYKQKIEDIQKWLSITNWNSQLKIEDDLLIITQEKLLQSGIIKKLMNPKNLTKKL